MRTYRNDPRDLVVARNWATAISVNALAFIVWAWLDLLFRLA